jgi:aryl-phospho-beta-D-glucosidase BglC (GH1 family)
MKNKLKVLAMVVLSFLGMQNAMAAVPNPPESLPATPTQEAASVLSFFCGVYTNPAAISSITGSSAVTKEVREVSGDEMIFIDGGLNSWEFINFSQSLDISQYDTFAFDIYIVAGGTPLKIKLSSTSSEVITSELPEGWSRVEIKLADFKNLATPPDLTRVNQIALLNSKGYARIAYIDNIYAFGAASVITDPELPSQPAPAPTYAADNVKSIYSDAYTSVTSLSQFSGTGTYKFFTIGNDQVMKIEGGLNYWSNIHLSPSINLNDAESLHFDVFVVRESGTIELKFAFNEGIGVVVARTLNPGWNFIDIPLDEFKTEGTTLTGITQLRLIRTGGYAQNVFMDNIYAYGITPGEQVDPNAPALPAPTPQHPSSDVISIFSDTYNSAAGLILNNAGVPPVEIDTITPFPDDDMIRFVSLNWTILKLEPVLDIDDSDYIHFDVWAEASPRIQLGLGNWDKVAYSDALTLDPGWKSFDIPLSVYKNQDVDLQDVLIMRFFSSSGFAINRLYFDNIYIYKGDPISDKPVPTYEIKSSPEPIMAHNTIKAIFTDKYTDITAVESGTPGETTAYNLVYLRDTDRVLRMRTLDELSVALAPAVNLTDRDSIHFNIYYDDAAGNGSLEIGLQDAPGTKKYSTVVPELTAGEWTYVNIPLQELKTSGLDASAINHILFRGSGNIYIDNIFAFKGNYTLGLGEEGKISVDWEEASKADALPDRDQAFLGVNLGSASGGEVPGIYNTNYAYPTFEELYYFKSKGVRLIRFPFKWERIQHDVNAPLDLELDVMKIKEIIAEAERIGMYVMPDMHNYCRRKINGTTYKFGESDNLTKEHFADVWAKLAAELKDFTNIWGYDIMNEPYGLLPGIWDEAAQAAINSIRNVDTNTPIVIEGGNYAAASTWPTTGGNLINLVDPSNKLIFQAHTYFDKDKSGLYELGSYDLEVTSPTEHINRLTPYVNWLKENNQKGILGEFGVPRYDARWLDLLDEVLAYLKANQVTATYWVAGGWSSGDKVSVQPLENYTVERAQMRILEKYFSNFSNNSVAIDAVKSLHPVNISTYPNPVIDKVSVESKQKINAIRILDITGKTVKDVQGTGNNMEIDLQNINRGIYILQVLFENGSSTSQKLIKM